MSQNILPQTETYPWLSFTGPLPFRMTSDYLFKFLLQSNTEVLKALICAYLDISFADIRKIQVTNSITLSISDFWTIRSSRKARNFSQNTACGMSVPDNFILANS
jgi:hypothetical protein